MSTLGLESNMKVESINLKGINSRPEAEECLHSACEQSIRHLNELSALHLAIDPPERTPNKSEAECVLRLRKVCLHVRAITSWDISADVLHVMAPDIRAAREQLYAIVLKFYDGYKDADISKLRRYWAEKEKDLALFSHPTAMALVQGRDVGGFGKADNIVCLHKLYELLAGLVCDYSIGLYMTAEVLDRSKQPEIRQMIDRSGAEFSLFPSDALLRFVERTE